MKRSLTFRCAQCERITRAIAIWWDEHTPASVRCSSCGRRYQLDPARPRQRSDRAYHLHMKKYAEEKRFDLATAWSVAEGIMTLEQARAYQKRSRLPRARATARSNWGASLLLLVLILGAGLVALALRVSNEEAQSAPPPKAAASLASARTAAPAVRQPSDEVAPSSRYRPWRGPAVVSRTDDAGNLVEISGPDPRSVLLAFCDSGAGAQRREPVGLAAAPPPDTGMKLGIYRDLDDLSSPLAIRIHKDPRARRWVAGDGRKPITGVDAGTLPARTKIVPVPAERRG